MSSIVPKPQSIQALMSDPDQGPVVMLNLLKFKPRAEGEEGTGADAYGRYGDAVVKMVEARGAERGQIVIPKAIRDRLGIRPGTVLQFRAERGRLIATKADAQDPFEKWYGCLGKNFDVDAYIERIRGR